MITTDLPIQDLEFQPDSIIKVIGVGGGGGNAVNYMYHKGIKDVSFLVCNTDRQALLKMDVPAKLQLGAKGLGAGGDPTKARTLAEESKEQIKEALSDGTEMVFITAGMGGGTGTGAAPVVAAVAQEMSILTVGVVTIPFAFEGMRQIRKAMAGIAQLAEHTDALLVINNEKLKQIYPDFDLPNAFNRSDEVVGNAAKAIAEIITIPGYINTDFADVYNTLKDGNMAIMNVGTAEGEERITRAIQDALHSPIVNTTDVKGASRILLNFYCSEENAIRMSELDQVDRFREEVGDDIDVKWGATYDNTLGDKVKVTLIATGYSVSELPGLQSALEWEKHKDEQPKKTVVNDKSLDDVIEKSYGDIKRPTDDVPFEIEGENKTPDENTTEPAETTQNTTAEDSQAPTETAATTAESDDTTADNEVIRADETNEVETVNLEELKEQNEKEDNQKLEAYSTGIKADEDIIFLDDLRFDENKEVEDIPSWMRRNK